MCRKCWTPNHPGLTCFQATYKFYLQNLDSIVVKQATTEIKKPTGRI